MSLNIPTHYVNTYSTNVSHLLQQKGSKLRGKVMSGSHTGEGASPVEQYGSLDPVEVTGRYESMPRHDINTDRRWVYPQDQHIAQLVDSTDKLRMIIDPNSPMTSAAVYGMGRKVDDVLLTAAFADAKTGKAGGTTEQFDTTNYQVAHGSAMLTVAKMKTAYQMLADADVDLDSEMPCMVINPRQHTALLNQIETTSTDYNSRPTLVDGRVRHFMGMEIIVTTRLQNDGTYDRVLVFVRSGIHLGIWRDITSESGIREDLTSRPTQLYTRMTIGATRLEQGRVVEIQCATS